MILNNPFYRRLQDSSPEEGGDGGGAATAEPTPEFNDAGASAAEEAPKSDWGEELPLYDSDNEPAPLPEELTGDEPATEEPAAEETAETTDIPASEEVDASPDEPQQASDADDFPAALLDRAAALGMSYSDIQAFGNQRALEHAVGREEMLRRSSQTPPPSQEQSATPETTGESQVIEPDFEQLIADGHDEGLVNTLRTTVQLVQESQNQVRELSTRLQQTEQQTQQQTRAQRDQQLQSMINDLGSDYAAVIGEKPGEVHPTSREYENQSALRGLVGILEAGMQAQGMTVPNQKQLLNIALSGIAGDHLQQQARQNLKRQIRNNGSQATTPANSGPQRKLTGEQAAVARWQKALGRS